MANKVFKNIKCVAFDLDGTLYLGNDLIDGALELIATIRDQGWQVFFVTNNSAKTRQQIYEKLITLGIQLELDEVMNSAYAVAKFLQDCNYQEIYCLGTDDFSRQICEMGINPKSSTPEAIVIGYDPAFNLQKLEQAIGVYSPNCKIIAANLERTYLSQNAIVSPGAGTIVRAFEFAVNQSINIFIGKPHHSMLEMLLSKTHFIPEDVLVVGDTYDSDVAMANLFGASAVMIYNKLDKIFDKCIVVKDLHQLKLMIQEEDLHNKINFMGGHNDLSNLKLNTSMAY